MTPEELNRMAKDPAMNKAQIWEATRSGVAYRIGPDGKRTGETKKAGS